MKAMGEHDIEALEIEKEGMRVSLKRPSAPQYAPQAPFAYQTHQMPLSSQIPEAIQQTAPETPKVEEGQSITSPMVGTFYRASSPDSDPFIKEGDVVDEHTVVCIIEAMKVMNEVKSGVKGVVKKVLVEDSHPVEFGTPLFTVEPR